ncbi:colanic acid biosynthesis glycosyltransferase WcaL [Luteitalea sp. TBR-22]|uniref:glycosyltransferase family 4 protein n=1 Tax=Luteitalea sp. TBR-22 TaxID=2802971 RepID=UPI001AF35217|nr:glycosyltransferase family 4 protein [Luteitalea sp. TBR-22]BCS34823.1 colanic acid biosynthesis glycosyltransferase WcaL [Luteitalea sp. TBR-22]
MRPADSTRVGYVVKRYPRYSETFIVTEILAHEAAGLDLDIISLRPPCDTHFQDALAQVRAPVHYLDGEGARAADLWAAWQRAAEAWPGLWARAAAMRGADARDVFQALQLARLVRDRGIGHLHAHFATLPAAVARLVAALTGITYSFTAHAKDIFHESVCRQELAARLRDASAVVTVSEFNLAYLRDTFGADAARVVRIYNGLDLARFPVGTARTAGHIVAVGRLVEKKGFEVLVDACAELGARGVAYTCDLIGTGELEDALRARIRARGVEARVRMLGARPQRDVAAAIAAASVFAAPCLVGEDGNRDGLPTTLLEAMASGTPCVSTDVTGIPEVIANGDTGWMVRQGDAVDLADVLQRVLARPETAHAVAARARRRIEQDFDAHRNAARVRALFAESADRGRAGASWQAVGA